MPSSFLTPAVRDPNKAREDAIQGMVETIIHENRNENISISDPDNLIPNQRKLLVNREKTPFQDFVNNDILIYSFPFLFLFGKGLRTSATIDTNTSRHLMLQFNSKFDSCYRFIFFLLYYTFNSLNYDVIFSLIPFIQTLNVNFLGFNFLLIDFICFFLFTKSKKKYLSSLCMSIICSSKNMIFSFTSLFKRCV